MNKIKTILSKIDINIVIILILSLIIMYPFFISPYIAGHDTYYHYANIFAILETIDFSNFDFFPSKVVPIIGKDFGWGAGLFYPSLPHYITAYLYIFGTLFDVTSIFTPIKVMHILVTFLSGLFMYIFAKKVFRNKFAALISAIVYITFPYYFIDVMVRDAYSETFMFMFLPLVFLGLEHLFENNYKKFYIYFVIGYVGSIYSHLISTVYMTFFVIIFLLFNYKKVFNKQTIKTLFIAAFIILGLTAPFTFALIEHTLFGSYAVYMDKVMCSAELMKETTVDLLDYFTTERPLAWTGEVVTPISLVGLLSFIIVLIYLIIKRKDETKPQTLKFYIILTFLAVIIMLPIIPWDHLPSFLYSIQFTWRLNLFLAFFMSISVGYIIFCFKPKWAKYVIISLTVILSLIMVYSLKPMVILANFDTSTFDINSYGMSSKQYFPAKTHKNLDYWSNRSDKVIVKEGKADIKIIENATPYLKFKVKTKESTLELPRFYYLGYDIRLNGQKIDYYENKYGFIEMKLKDSGTVTVKYTGTLFDKIGIIIFSLMIILIIAYFIYDYRKKE